MTMSELVYRNLELVGPPRYDEEARRVAREIQKNLGLEPMEEPLTRECPQDRTISQRN